MKKILFIVIVVAVVVYVFGILIPNIQEEKNAEQAVAGGSEAAAPGGMGGPGGPGMGGPGGHGMGGPRRNPMEDLKNDEGMIVIAKIDESEMPEDRKAEMKESLTAADADGDGLLNEEEQKAYEETRRAARLARMFDGIKNDEGQYDLSKLEDARMFPPAKEAAKNADADGDGFLNEEELQAAKDAFAEAMANGPRGMGGPGGPGMGGPGGPGMGGPGGPGMGPGGPGEGAPAPAPEDK